MQKQSNEVKVKRQGKLNNHIFESALMLFTQLTSKVDGGITGSRLRWSILT